MNKLDDALGVMNKLFFNNECFMYEFERKFFPLTLQKFKNSADQNKETAKELVQTFEDLCQRIEKANQLNHVDLPELAVDYVPIKLKKKQEAKY